MSNYPPGVTGTEPEIDGYTEGSRKGVKCLNTIPAKRVMVIVDPDWTIPELLRVPIPDQAMMMVHRLDECNVDEIDCPYEGEMEGYFARDMFIGKCPVCDGETEIEL